ncbi:MAG TPA: hypothetical protein VLJ17_14710 [Xanthobacteraceae bacterium]|nr:hypothetical protein [Xanthobacteraceae bacterium]
MIIARESISAAGVLRWLAGLVLAMQLTPADALAAQCRPRRPLPSVVLQTMGPCDFNVATLSFAGNSVQQAACLVRPVNPWAHLGPPLESLPKVLADRVGRPEVMPDRAALAALINEVGLAPQFADGLASQVSRARDGDPLSPMARYFVIHDTSGPKLGSFPANLNENAKINNLARFHCTDSFELAHAVINRKGGVFFGHDFAVPWRSTKFERALFFGNTLKGLFLHVEMIQPRRRGPGRHANDIAAPSPGFTSAQYGQLALLYTIASVRAGEWLIPAFHAVIDGDLRGGHDDPQNFELAAFAQALEGILDRLAGEREQSPALGQD